MKILSLVFLGQTEHDPSSILFIHARRNCEIALFRIKSHWMFIKTISMSLRDSFIESVFISSFALINSSTCFSNRKQHTITLYLTARMPLLLFIPTLNTLLDHRENTASFLFILRQKYTSRMIDTKHQEDRILDTTHYPPKLYL